MPKDLDPDEYPEYLRPFVDNPPGSINYPAPDPSDIINRPVPSYDDFYSSLLGDLQKDVARVFGVSLDHFIDLGRHRCRVVLSSTMSEDTIEMRGPGEVVKGVNVRLFNPYLVDQEETPATLWETIEKIMKHQVEIEKSAFVAGNASTFDWQPEDTTDWKARALEAEKRVRELEKEVNRLRLQNMRAGRR